MKLAQALRLSGSESVAFVGAGGKTSAIFKLARELNPPVVVTTTTHLGVWQAEMADRHFIITSDKDRNPVQDNRRGVMLVTGPLKDDRFTALTPTHLSWLHAMCGYHSLPLLIEADGARQKALKAPAAHEPAIPKFVKHVVVVAGLSELGNPVSEESVHRPEMFETLSGSKEISTEALASVLTHPKGGLKNIPNSARRVALLSQADTPGLQSQGKILSERLLGAYDSIVIASLKAQKVIAVHETIAGIILAAGKSSRFGQPKQLLDWHGQPFVRVVAQTALAAGLAPVTVVTGANAEQVEAAVSDLPVQIARNGNWLEGQASSIGTGIETLWQPPPSTQLIATKNRGFFGGRNSVGGAIFLLADQPQVTIEVIRALVEHHAGNLFPVIAPYVFDQRGNPVLFDSITFKALMKLTGEQGGRAIFSQFSPRYLNWYDRKLLLDVDTPDDYERLLKA